jgi:putative ABC transport system permease protein
MFALSLKSLYNRKLTTLLTIAAIALSVTLLLGVERIRKEAKTSFTHTISGTDLIVGARSGPVQLLLYSVFRIGNATNNISWKSYQEIARYPNVRWTIPISLGDSHQGYRVMGTNFDYFEHFRFAGGKRLELADGRILKGSSMPCSAQKWPVHYNTRRMIPSLSPMVPEKSVSSCMTTNRSLWWVS